MTLTKTVLTMLGSLALMAGTVLAFAEPPSQPLPEAATMSACSSKCAAGKKSASACSKSRCGTAPCAIAVTGVSTAKETWAASTCSKAELVAACASKCAAESKSCSTKCGSENEVAAACCESKCCEKGLKAVAACTGETKACNEVASCNESSTCNQAKIAELRIGAGINSEADGHGLIVITAGIDGDECPDGKCTAASDGCRGHKVVGIEFTGDLTPSIKSRTVFVKNCKRCGESTEAVCSAKACDQESVADTCAKTCNGGSCDTKCERRSDIVATACEAKAACATSVCSAVSCAAPRCATTAVATEASCTSCENCACESCSCDSACDEEALPTIRSGSPQAATRRFFLHRNETSAADAPGRVHMTHIPANPYFFPGSFPSLATGARFDAVHSWRQLLPASFTTTEAPRPSDRSSATHGIEGTWTRTVNGKTITFTCDNGRIHGTCQESHGETPLRFSGMCSISEDGQIFGLIDDVGGTDMALPVRLTGWVIDQPFAVRCRIANGELIVKDFRCAGAPSEIEIGGESFDIAGVVQMFACGRFERLE